jgi:hypothetical protein
MYKIFKSVGSLLLSFETALVSARIIRFKSAADDLMSSSFTKPAPKYGSFHLSILSNDDISVFLRAGYYG